MRAILPAFLAILISTSAVSFAQTSIRIFRYTPENVPAKLIVLRGAVIEFAGELKDDGLSVGFELRTGARAVSGGSFQKSWLVRYETAKEFPTTNFLALWRIEPNGKQVRLCQFSVMIVETAPFKIGSPTDYSSTDGPLTVQVETIGRLKIAGGAILVDGKPRPGAISPTGQAIVDVNGVAPGDHLVTARVSVEGAGDYTTTAIHVGFASRIKLIRSDVGPVDLRRGNPKVSFHVELPADVKARSAEFFINEKSFGLSTQPPFNDVLLDPQGLASGEYNVRVEVSTAAGSKVISPNIMMQIIGDSRNEFIAFKSRAEALVGEAAKAYELFQTLYEAYKDNMTGFGPLDLSARNLIGTDGAVLEKLQRLEVPGSLSELDRQQLRQAIQRFAIAFNLRIGAEKKLVRLLELPENAPSNVRDGLLADVRGGFNRADVAMTGAIQQFEAVADRIGIDSAVPADAPPSATRAPSFTLTYPETGDRQQDFVNWRNKLDQVISAATEARSKYLASGNFITGPANLAMRDLLGADAFVSAKIDKVPLPRALPETIRQEMRDVQQSFAIAFNQFVGADKLELAELERRLNAGSKESARPISTGIQGMFNKSDITYTRANVKLAAIAKKLGLE